MGHEKRALLKPPFLAVFNMEQAMLSMKMAGWSFKVLPSEAVMSGQQSSDQYYQQPVCRIETADSSVIFHSYPFPLLQVLGWLWFVDVDESTKTCAV